MKFSREGIKIVIIITISVLLGHFHVSAELYPLLERM
jgi:hypothetical protein